MLQSARHPHFRPLAAALVAATVLAGPALAREGGFAQAEWAQDYSSPTTMQRRSNTSAPRSGGSSTRRVRTPCRR